MLDNKQRNHQWRIQDFPEGVPSPKSVLQAILFDKFLPKLHENERNWTEGRGMRQVATPPPQLESVTGHFNKHQKITEVL